MNEAGRAGLQTGSSRRVYSRVLIWEKEEIKLNLKLFLIKGLRGVLSVFKITCRLFRIQVRTRVPVVPPLTLRLAYLFPF